MWSEKGIQCPSNTIISGCSLTKKVENTSLDRKLHKRHTTSSCHYILISVHHLLHFQVPQLILGWLSSLKVSYVGKSKRYWELTLPSISCGQQRDLRASVSSRNSHNMELSKNDCIIWRPPPPPQNGHLNYLKTPIYLLPYWFQPTRNFLSYVILHVHWHLIIHSPSL